MRWREKDGVRWLEAELPGARVAFTTRLGGVSEGPFESLNLGLLSGDPEDAVSENRRRLAAALGLAAERIVHGRQVHGSELAVHFASSRHAATLGAAAAPGHEDAPTVVAAPEVDGHVVTEPGLAALVFAADCLPVALAGPGGLAMLHCGWRGLAAGIVAKGAAAIGATAAAIGPGIGPCCYEVGPEVLEALAEAGGLEAAAAPIGANARRDAPPAERLDLAGAARRLLVQEGVGDVSSAGLCTACNPELFFSHRRDCGRTGRQAGLAWLEAS